MVLATKQLGTRGEPSRRRDPIFGGPVQYQVWLGVTSVTLSMQLPKNAVVRQLDVVATVTPTGNAALGSIASSLTMPSATSVNSSFRLVADFGTLRTVNHLQIKTADVGASDVTGVYAWAGTKFDQQNLFVSSSGIDIALSSDCRTERLAIDFDKTFDVNAIGDTIGVFLSDTPADFTVKINDAAPAWSSPGPASLSTTSDLSASQWNKNGARIVPLADALAALTGDSGADIDDLVALEIKFASRAPASLSLDRHAGDPTFEIVDYAARVPLDGGKGEVTFASEGRTSIALPMPSWAAFVNEVQFTLVGALPLDRALPPLSPPPSTLAYLTLDPAHSIAVRAPDDTTLVEISAVRLPLTAMDGSAEARVLLLADADGEPGDPLPGAASTPLVLEAVTDGSDTWSTFAFPKPVPMPANRPWILVLVSRGALTWSLGVYDAGATDKLALRRGPPTGPFTRLPGAMDFAPFDQHGGRARIVGRAGRDAPVPPLHLALTADATPPTGLGAESITPIAKGDRVDWGLDRPGVDVRTTHALTLWITSSVAGNISLSDLDIIATNS